jgi:hypothetical protein
MVIMADFLERVLQQISSAEGRMPIGINVIPYAGIASSGVTGEYSAMG